MKFSININQKELYAVDDSLDLVDAAIFCWVSSFMSSKRCKKMVVESETYYRLSPKFIIKDIPMMRIKDTSTIRKRLKKLSDAGIITPYPANQMEGVCYYTHGPNYEACLREDSEHSSGDKITGGRDLKHTSPRDLNPVSNTFNTNPLSNSSVSNDTNEVSENKVLDKKEIQNTSSGEDGPYEARLSAFRKEVFDVGGATYTSTMLNNFINTWSQPNKAKKPRMRWEKERDTKGWELKFRLNTWANNNFNNIQCYLTEEQKTIAQRRLSFAKTLEPYVAKYGRDMVNAFYQHWSQPENELDPNFLRWEKEKFWDVPARLELWKKNPLNKPNR